MALPRPTAVPAAPGLVTTLGAVMVIEYVDLELSRRKHHGPGDRAAAALEEHPPMVCVGFHQDSYPPGGGGPPLIGWDWSRHPDAWEEAGGVRWGDFKVTGTFDGTSLTVTSVVPATDLPPDEPTARERSTTRCPEPAGGWVVDDSKLERADLRRAIERADELGGFSASWIDTSRDPRSEAEIHAQNQASFGGSHAASTVLNVLVTQDEAGAEQVLREHWGGGLCLSRARATERRLREVKNQVGGLPGWLSLGIRLDQVSIAVTYDDGSIQAWADDAFGPGLVFVGSALRDVD